MYNAALFLHNYCTYHSVSTRIEQELSSPDALRVYETEYFEQALMQTHHRKTTVALHTLGVAAVSLRLYYVLARLGMDLDKKCLVRAALCHDLGILGRDEKFDSTLECYTRHPLCSADTAKVVFPDLDGKTENCILCHMFPLTGKAPQYTEGAVLILADKYCAIAENIEAMIHRA